MKARNGWLIMIFVGAVCAIGCKKPVAQVTVAVMPATEPAAPQDTGPTTQELMSGTYKPVSLSPLPLSASVPETWDVKSIGAKLNLLQGPIPSGGEVQIALTTGTPIPSANLDRILEAAKRAADKEKQTTQLFNVKTVGDMKVMEMQKLVTAGEPGQPSAIDWQVSCFVHGEVDYSVYVLDVSLTDAQFEQSKELLRKILDSISYQPSPAG